MFKKLANASMQTRAWLIELPYAIIITVLTIFNFYYARMEILRNTTAKENLQRYAELALTVVAIIAGISIAKRMAYCMANERLSKVQEELYFLGYSLKDIVDNATLLRLQNWVGSGMCYELSILAMLQCKGIKSAKLCRGYVIRKDGTRGTNHSWVEIKMFPFCRYVVDFAWGTGDIETRKEVIERAIGDGKLIKEWKCSHKKFWKIPYVKRLYEAISCRETSHVLNSLESFVRPDSYGFKPRVFDPNTELCELKSLTPQSREGAFMRPITNSVFSAFAENPELQEPDKNTLKHARIEYLKSLRKLGILNLNHPLA